MRRTPLVLTLVLVVSCDTPSTTSVPEPRTTLASPASAEWTKDTVPLHRYLPEGMAGDFTPDTIFPFHLYWHNGGVHPRIRAAVRTAAAQWASIVGPTEVLPYVFGQNWSCGVGTSGVLLSYAEGDTLAGGFHVYVSSDPSLDVPHVAWATGPCIPYTATGEASYHPVTNAPPNGFTFIGEALADLPSIESTAVHEIGHLLGHGIGDRWWAGLEWDSVTVNGQAEYFRVQTDSVAIRRYEDWIRHQVEIWTDPPIYKKPYPLRKLPLAGSSHWDGCILSEYPLNQQRTDVMAYRGHGPRRVITQVTASMLQGFEVDWDQFVENDFEIIQWSPDDRYWTECREVQLTLDSLGLAMDRSSDTIHVNLPDIPDLGDDIRPWTYIRQGR